MIGIGIDIYPETNILGYFEGIEGIEGENSLEKNEDGNEINPKHCKLKLLNGKSFENFERNLNEVLIENENNGYIYLVDKNHIIKQQYFFNDLEIVNKQDLENDHFNLEISCILYQACKGVYKVWQMRINKELTEYNLWTKIQKEDRQGWLEVAINFQKNVKDRENLEVEINGELIDNTDAFYCTLGESINGPGGYFGRNFDALYDCFCGNFGVKLPFTLVWKNHLESKENLNSNFDKIIEELEFNKVKIELK